jgi:hypothetical protein
MFDQADPRFSQADPRGYGFQRTNLEHEGPAMVANFEVI